MIPDPSTADRGVGEDGSGSPARDTRHDPSSRAGHLFVCAGCGQPLEPWTRDLWCFASETTVAYWPCFLAATR